MAALTYQDRVAVARLHALLELLPTALDRQLASEGLTAFEFTLLEALHEAPEGRLRLSALASRTNATLPRLSRVVTALEKKGLVMRAACEADARATNAILTAGGQEAYAEARPKYEAAVQEMILQDLDTHDVTAFSDHLLAVLTRLDPDRKLAVTAESTSECAADPVADCAADPAPACAADPAHEPECAADPEPSTHI